MFKLLIILAMLTLLNGCEQQKQASAEVGAIPKTIIDKATNDIKAAEALAAEQVKALVNIEAAPEAEK
jgi:hypothetical protein